MRRISGALSEPTLRACMLFVMMALLFTGIALQSGVALNNATIFSVLQNFATVGLVALGLGLTVLIGEFDLSVAGMFVLGGCVAVLAGSEVAAFGLIVAIVLGLVGGAAQAVLMVKLGLNSVAITLGGLLTFTGIAHVLTESKSILFNNFPVALAMNAPVFGVFSQRSLVTIVCFLIVGVVITYTRLGRDIVATGSNRQAARVAGVNTSGMLIGVFAASGGLAALGGALLSFGLSAASPSGLSNVMIPAIAAVILGGGSLSGGVGHPIGIAAGVLVLSIVRSGLTILGVSPSLHEIVTGALLLAVAIVDGPALSERLYQLKAQIFGRLSTITNRS